MRADEIKPRKLVIFDIDDTLVHTQTTVQVINKDGQATKELNSHEFTHYKLQPGEKFDFENFRNAHDFFHNSKPIIPMMNQLKQDIATGNQVVMVTARADFDDRELFLDTFRKYGVDMSKVHVYRAGNMNNKIQTEEKKKIIIRNLLSKGRYTKAIMYDDAEPNLQSFVELKAEYPKTKFYAWHVSLEGEANEYDRTDEDQALEERRKKKRKSRNAAYGPGLFGGYGYYAGYSGDSSGDGGGGDGGGESIREDTDKKEAILRVQKMLNDKYDANLDLDGILGPLTRKSINKFMPDAKIGLADDPNKTTAVQGKKIKENFADGKNPEDKGDSKRYGINTKASVSSLRKTAKQGGRKGQLAHWMANMKAGRAKNK
jgi:FMN phosphatase YigB (HAD superfamily)